MIPRAVYEQTIRSHLAPVAPYLDDPSVSEIMVNGPNQIYVERRGHLARVDARFAGHEALMAALRAVSQYLGRVLDDEHPILEGRLPDGSRFEAVIPPACPDGPCVAIRRFFRDTLTLARLVELDALTPLLAETLRAFVTAKVNIVIAGGTGSGKTSMLNALSGMIPEAERTVVIEDAREVQLQQPHVVQLEARPADARGRGAVTIRELLRATLRLRPDRVILGELRGGEALDLLQAMTSGHGGCMGTLHASHPRDALTRLETMALMSDVDLPLSALRMQIGSGLQVVLQVARLKDGTRKVTHVTEIVGYDVIAQRFTCADLFVREYGGVDASGRVVSRLLPTGETPTFAPQLEAYGVALPTGAHRAHGTRTTVSVASDERPPASPIAPDDVTTLSS